jgi:flagellar L-ring protein precursor FlgH
VRAAKTVLSLLIGAAAVHAGLLHKKKDSLPAPTALDEYVSEAIHREQTRPASDVSPGSLWSPGSLLADASRDVRASQVDDIVTIVVAETASAVTTGATKTARASANKSSITALAGQKNAASALANLSNLSASTTLNGSGTSSRQTSLNTTLTARVTQVLPNGNLVLEGSKTLVVNSEHQTILVRGVARVSDLSAGNTVPSDHLAQLEVNINGKGVVNDAIHRPFFLYRVLLGLLPF